MKKILTLALAAMMTLSLVACSPAETTKPDTTTPDVTTPEVEDVTIDLDAFAADIEGKVMMPMLGSVDEMMLKDSFGIEAADVEAFMVRIPMMAVTATEYGIFKGDSDVIKTAIDTRLAALETTWSQYLPDQYQLVLDYTTYTEGDYTLYVIAPEADKQYFENVFQRAFDDSIEELIPAASFEQVTGEIVSVEENGVTLLVDGTYTIQGTYADYIFINPDENTGEELKPEIGMMVDVAFETAVVDNGDEVLQGVLTYMGVSVNVGDMGGDMAGDMGVGDMGVGDMGMGDMGVIPGPTTPMN